MHRYNVQLGGNPCWTAVYSAVRARCLELFAVVCGNTPLKECLAEVGIEPDGVEFDKLCA